MNTDNNDKRIIVSGHRGESTYNPENTMAAIRAAVGYGVDMIETDIHMTKDRLLVLRHDEIIPGAGRVKDFTYDELLKVKPDLPLLEELLELAQKTPDLILNLEFKDVPCSDTANSGGAGSVQNIDPGMAAMDNEWAYECADRVLDMVKEASLEKRALLCSFSGKIIDYAYNREGKKFSYHAFYPFFIMGEMENDPAQICSVACMQHRYMDRSGNVIRYDDPLCPKEWFENVSAMGLVPLAAPSLTTYENFDAAFSYGARIVNANDPKGMIEHLKTTGLNR